MSSLLFHLDDVLVESLAFGLCRITLETTMLLQLFTLDVGFMLKFVQIKELLVSMRFLIEDCRVGVDTEFVYLSHILNIGHDVRSHVRI